MATNEIFNKLNTDNLNSVDELTASLNRFLRKLPEKDRTVFLLRYYYAGTKEDIARKTGLSSNQVKYILQKVRKQLADTLKKEGLQ